MNYSCTITVKGTADSEPEARRAIAEALSDPDLLAFIKLAEPSWFERMVRAIGWPCAVIAAYCAGALIAGG